MFVVCESILALARTELSLFAGQDGFAGETNLLHMTSEVGLQAHHTQRRVVSGALVESVKFGEA